MAVAYSDGCSRIFDLRTWQMIHAFEAHQHSVFALQYSPDGQQLVSGGRDAHLKIWETREYILQKDIAAHLFAINDLVFRPILNIWLRAAWTSLSNCGVQRIFSYSK
jgi:WD repeat-containing protein 61